MINILLVDDYAAVRTGLRMRLSLEPDLHIVGEAYDGANAIDLARHLNPELIIMDVYMPNMDGISAARHLKDQATESEIIILTSEDTVHVQENAKAAGVAAVLPKNDRVDQLIAAIRAIMSHRQKRLAVA
jgi:DNA-binding NarL/FixJ family response regulator